MPHTRTTMTAIGVDPPVITGTFTYRAPQTGEHYIGFGGLVTATRDHRHAAFVLNETHPREHVAYVCTVDHEFPGCIFCDGGLFACTICGSFEGATTSECPGKEMSDGVRDSVYAGKLDYRGGAWIAEPSPHTPNGRRQHHPHDNPPMIDTHRCDLGDGHHIMNDGSIG